MAAHPLAQVNIATLRYPLDTPELASFVAQLEPINALADAHPGFVWRLQTEDGDATAIRPFGDERIIVNLSVWSSLEALRGFVYATRHLDVMRHRRRWFQRMADPFLALWWVPAGTSRPSPRPATASTSWPAGARPPTPSPSGPPSPNRPTRPARRSSRRPGEDPLQQQGHPVIGVGRGDLVGGLQDLWGGVGHHECIIVRQRDQRRWRRACG
jgi:hypothetical protein